MQDGEWVITDEEIDYPVPIEAGIFPMGGSLVVAELRQALIRDEDGNHMAIIQIAVSDLPPGNGSSPDIHVLPPFFMPGHFWYDICRHSVDSVEGALDSEPVESNTCPGCGRNLHGSLRWRGACTDCFPRLDGGLS